jgi:Tfp pilus assembly protein PilW
MNKGIKIALIISGVVVLATVSYFLAKNKGWIKSK